MRQKEIKKDKINTDKAFERHSNIADRELQRRKLFIENVQDLVKMFETQEFKAIIGFDPPPKWAGYLSLIEIYYSRAQVDRWRKIWYKLVNDFGLDIDNLVKVPDSRLEDIMKVANTKEESEELLGIAEHATSLDWKNELASRLGKDESYDCKHSFKIEQRCTKCGEKHEIEAGKE